jgi:hypothetical protein
MDPAAFAEAVSQQAAPEERQEAPASAAVPASFEPDPNAAPIDGWEESEPAPPSVPQPPDWDDPRNPYREQALQAQAERERLQQQANQALYQQAVEAWNRAEAEQQERTSRMDAYEANDSNREFYKARERGLVAAYQQLQDQTRQYQTYVTVQQQAQQLVTQHNLAPEDAEALMALGALDPARMAIEAKRRGDAKKKTDEMERRIARLETGEEREDRIASGADRFGGRGGTPTRKREFTGSDEELAGILRSEGVLRALGGR